MGPHGWGPKSSGRGGPRMARPARGGAKRGGEEPPTRRGPSGSPGFERPTASPHPRGRPGGKSPGGEGRKGQSPAGQPRAWYSRTGARPKGAGRNGHPPRPDWGGPRPANRGQPNAGRFAGAMPGTPGLGPAVGPSREVGGGSGRRRGETTTQSRPLAAFHRLHLNAWVR